MTPWNDLEAFADIFGYLCQRGIDIPAHYLETHARYRYGSTVFILPPWPEIYINDTKRPQTLAESKALHDAVRKAYESLGYDLIEVPRMAVKARCEFVLRNL